MERGNKKWMEGGKRKKKKGRKDIGKRKKRIYNPIKSLEIDVFPFPFLSSFFTIVLLSFPLPFLYHFLSLSFPFR